MYPWCITIHHRSIMTRKWCTLANLRCIYDTTRTHLDWNMTQQRSIMTHPRWIMTQQRCIWMAAWYRSVASPVHLEMQSCVRMCIGCASDVDICNLTWREFMVFYASWWHRDASVMRRGFFDASGRVVDFFGRQKTHQDAYFALKTWLPSTVYFIYIKIIL